jgi:hypothetical protein
MARCILNRRKPSIKVLKDKTNKEELWNQLNNVRYEKVVFI